MYYGPTGQRLRFHRSSRRALGHIPPRTVGTRSGREICKIVSVIWPLVLVDWVMTDSNMMKEEWLKQLDGLRPLAQRLVRDESRADDAVQRTLLKAMTSKGLPRAKGFWARVLRNEAIDARRAERTRRHHEERGRRDPIVRSTHSVVSEAESQSIVSDAVLALDEPYRTVILLRFFKGLKVRQIAAEVDRPMGTVQSQLDRGLELLRGRLRAEFGNGHALALGLLPLATGQASLLGVPAASFSLFLIPIAMKLAWILPLLVLGWLGLRTMTSEPSTPESAGENHREALHGLGDPHRPEPREVTPPTLGATNESRVALEGSNASATEPGEGPDGRDVASTLLQGRAIRIDGSPWTHAALALGESEAAQTIQRTDDAGNFEYSSGEKVRALDDGWSLLSTRETPTLHEFLFAPTVRFAGEVVDESGAPLPGVMILDAKQLAQAGFDANAGWSRMGASGAVLKRDGRFDLKDVPTWTGRSVTLSHPAFGEHIVSVPSSDQLESVIVFPGATAGYTLVVRVVDEDGHPVTDAAVVFGPQVIAVDARGEVQLDVDSSSSGRSVTAIRNGFLPVSELVPKVARTGGSSTTPTLLLTHSEALAPITGIVVDADGTPVQGAKIKAWNGRATQDARTFATLYVADGELEYRRVVSDHQGRFTLPRSTLESMEVRAAASRPLRMGHAASNGEPVRIVLPAPETRCSVRGKVVDFYGEPVGRARVSIVARLHPSLHAGGIRWENAVGTAVQEADAEGRFEFIKEGGPELEVTAAYGSHRTIQPIDPSSSELTIQVDLACEVELNVLATSPGTTLSVIDAEGQALRCRRHYRSLLMEWRDEQRLPTEGATMLFQMPQSAHEVQLVVNGKVERSAFLKPSRSRGTRVTL